MSTVRPEDITRNVPYVYKVVPAPAVMIDYASHATSVIVYLLSAVVIIFVLYGSFKTIKYYNRGDINSRFPLLLLFNALCILFFALFAIIGVASKVNQYALNVILISCCGIAFTIQLLRSVRLLFTIEVRYFISKQFANQFAFGEAEVDMLLFDDDYEQSQGSEGSMQENSLAYDEDDEYYSDDEFYEESLQYSASYFDYKERDAEFGNYDDEEDDMEISESSKGDLNAVTLAGGDSKTAPNTSSIHGDSANNSLFSTSSELSAELENEDDVGNTLGRWIFQHKALATAPFMTGLSVFMFCKFLILTVLFTTAPGLRWAYILWIVMLSLGVISCALTILSLKMVRIRSFYIYERTLQDYNDKYFPKPSEDELLENELMEAQARKDEEEAAALQAATGVKTESQSRGSVARPSSTKPSGTRHGSKATESSSSRGATRGGRIRSESESSETHSSRAGMASRHGQSKLSKLESRGIKRATNGQQFINAADAGGAIGIFGAVIVQTNKNELDARKSKTPQGLTQRKPGGNRITSSNVRSTTSQSNGSTQKDSALSGSLNGSANADGAANLELFQEGQHEIEPDPNRPPPPQPPPTSLFTSLGDPSGQMLELLSSALVTVVLYSIALLIAIVCSAKHDMSQEGYFTLTPTRYSPQFTRGILILLLFAKAVIIYSSLVHILVADRLRAVKWMLFGGRPQVDVAQADMDDLDSLKKILIDVAARDEFRKFLDGEFSAENLLFWNAIEEYRSRPTAHFQSRTDTISSAKYIFSTYLAPGGVYEVNISSQCREKISTRLKVLLEDDPILPVRKFENAEVNEALEDWQTNGAYYHTFIWNESINDGLKIREYGDPEEEPQLPKGARAIASVVVNQYAKAINDGRRAELAGNPYPSNLFEQYCLIQIRDIYECILRSSQQYHNGGDPAGAAGKGKQLYDPVSKMSKGAQQQHDYGSRHADYASRHNNHDGGHGRIQNIQEDGPHANPPQLPDLYTNSPKKASQQPSFAGVLALLDDDGLDAQQQHRKDMNTAGGRRMVLAQQQQQQQQQHRRAQVRVINDGDDEQDDSDDEDEHINVAEWSYTRDEHDRQQVDDLNDPASIENNLPPGWTLYDLLKYKHQQQASFKKRYQNALATEAPLANPPELNAGPRRRGRGGRGRPGAQQQGIDLGDGQKLHHALMSYNWKLEACRRRLKHYTDIVDELVLVFDAAQLEIFKLMERDSFARFVKTPDFQQFVAHRNAQKAAQDE